MPSTSISKKKLALTLSLPVALYAVLLGLLTTPYFQRFALYAHKIHTHPYLSNITNPESFGFSPNQVTPFRIRTSDGETLYAWHILPLDVYVRNEGLLLRGEEEEGLGLGLGLLTSTSTEHEPARVVISYLLNAPVTNKSHPPPRKKVHGNAGHIAQGWRPDTYHRLTTLPNTHVLTIDYRGFGLSSGSPTEAGLIADGIALVTWVLNVAGIPPERIVILGQSLGTAVAGAVGLAFAEPGSALLPPLSMRGDERGLLNGTNNAVVAAPTTFAGIVLVAPFSSLPSLMLTYRIGGYIPILLPLRPFPWIAKKLTSGMVDPWPTADRLAAYYSALTTTNNNSSKLLFGGGAAGGRSLGSLQILHAVNDADISYTQTELICRRMFGDLRGGGGGGDGDECIDGSKGAAVLDVRRQGRPRVRFEFLEYGGHNRLVTYTPVSAAVMRGFEDFPS